MKIIKYKHHKPHRRDGLSDTLILERSMEIYEKVLNCYMQSSLQDNTTLGFGIILFVKE